MTKIQVNWTSRVVLGCLLALGVHGRLSAEQKSDLSTAGAQIAPGAAAAGATKLGGLPLSEWLVIASMFFIILQASYLVWKWRRDARREEDRLAKLRPFSSELGPLE